MNKKTEEILQGLKTAIEAELTGHEFYKSAAKTTSDPVGKETFSRMAKEELGHFNYLRHQYKSVLEKGEYDFTKKLLKKDHKHADSPIFSDEIKRRIKDSHFEVSALTIGMKLELDAMRFYKACAEKTDNENVKKFYAELADWEKDHYRAFEQQLDMLKEDYFHANNFFPM
ncbi:MAG: ferritin family protein [Thermodesulfobacteriota bacterium]|nr:ferritin family protein [Thermodesulfobacteriota bacterium]